MRRLFVSLHRVAVAALAILAVGAGLALGAAPAQALGTGTVCMFNAPSGAQLGPANMGHVGWAFRIGGTQGWEFGATENASYNWRDSGDQTTMFNTFKGLRGHGIATGYYTQWRCRNTANSSVTAASNKVNELYGQSYDLLWNNCLTRSVTIFQAYDSSLNDLPGAGATGPNWYFDNELTNFGAKHPL